MTWFGESWGAPVNESNAAPTPVGVLCGYCNKPIADGDNGVILPYAEPEGNLWTTIPFHLDCFLFTLGLKEKPNA